MALKFCGGEKRKISNVRHLDVERQVPFSSVLTKKKRLLLDEEDTCSLKVSHKGQAALLIT